MLSFSLLILFKTYPKAQLTRINLESKLAEALALLDITSINKIMAAM